MSRRCEQELCPNWTGDGDFCPCVAFHMDYAQPATEDATALTTPGEGDGTGSGPGEAHGAAEGDDWVRTGQLWAELREWLRMHGKYRAEIEPWGIYGCVVITVRRYATQVYSDQGMSLAKRLENALAYLREVDHG